MHRVYGEGVSVLLGFPRIGDFEQASRHKYHRARAGYVAEQKAHQERYTAAMDHHAEVIAMADMAHFMGDHASKLIEIFRFLQ